MPGLGFFFALSHFCNNKKSFSLRHGNSNLVHPLGGMVSLCAKVSHKCELARMYSASIISPIVFFQTMTGVGTPCAWQCKAIWRFRSTLTSLGSTIQRGGTIMPTQNTSYHSIVFPHKDRFAHHFMRFQVGLVRRCWFFFYLCNLLQLFCGNKFYCGLRSS